MEYYKKLHWSDLYHDLRDNMDDTTILENPNKGWYLHYVDNGMPSKLYRTDIAEGDYLENIPGMNILYLRLDWKDIENVEGVFDWSYVDDVMKKWGARGYKFNFRFCAFEGKNNGIPFSTPEWVFEKYGAKYVKVEEVYEPVYDDPVFLEHWENFLKECGRKFDGHPLVEQIDISGFGTWGEFHTFDGSGRNYPADFYKLVIDMNSRIFPNTQLICNYGAVVGLFDGDTREEQYKKQKEMLDYCVQMGFGVRCDSVDVDWYSQEYGYTSIQTPDLYDCFYKTAPVDMEHAHISMTRVEEDFREGFPYQQAMRDVHATYSGFHHWSSEWYAKYYRLHDYLANRLGYWYFLDGYAFANEVQSGTRAMLTFDVTNKGFAPAYKKYDLKVALFDWEGNMYEVEVDDTSDNRRWAEGQRTTENVRLKFTGIPAGEYKMGLGLFTQDATYDLEEDCISFYDRAIKFAIKEKFIEKGYCILGNVVVK